MFPNIIGLSGELGAGKDTVRSILNKLFEQKGIHYEHVKFATAIRKCVEVITGVPVSVSETTQGKDTYLPKFKMTVGAMLQQVGIEMVLNNTHPHVWVDALFRNLDPTKHYIISDVRTEEEFDAIVERGGIVIKLCSRRPVSDETKAGRSMTHKTEKELERNPSFIVNNDNSLSELELYLRDIVNGF
jgi:hypothetical protein